MTISKETIENLAKVASLVCEARCLLDEVVAEVSESKVEELDQWELEDTLCHLENCENVLDTINGKGLIERDDDDQDYPVNIKT